MDAPPPVNNAHRAAEDHRRQHKRALSTLRTTWRRSSPMDLGCRRLRVEQPPPATAHSSTVTVHGDGAACRHPAPYTDATGRCRIGVPSHGRPVPR